MTSISSSSLDFQAKMHLILMFSTKAKPLKKKVYFRTISLKIKEKSILLHKLKLVFDLFVLMNLRIRKLILSGLTFKFVSMSLQIQMLSYREFLQRFHAFSCFHKFYFHDFHLRFDFQLLRRRERPLSKGGSVFGMKTKTKVSVFGHFKNEIAYYGQKCQVLE